MYNNFTALRGIFNSIRNNNIRLTISDTGIGMNEKTKNSLFEIGNTNSLEGTNGETGTGFGLMISNEFVKKHNGEILVESKLNEGTTFTLVFPVNN